MEDIELRAYFENTPGLGVLATADGMGKVDAALFARPRILEDGTLAFVMEDRLTRYNTLSNPHAAYLYVEADQSSRGLRLFLTKIREEKAESRQLLLFSRPEYRKFDTSEEAARFLVFYKIDKVLPLVT